jgi:hypothetical protein
MNEKNSSADDTVESLIAEIADELIQRLNRGEQPKVEEYLERYPQIAGEVRKLRALEAKAEACYEAISISDLLLKR